MDETGAIDGGGPIRVGAITAAIGGAGRRVFDTACSWRGGATDGLGAGRVVASFGRVATASVVFAIQAD